MTDAIHKTKRGKYYIHFLLRNSFISSFLILNFIIGSVYTDAQNVKTLEDRRFASFVDIGSTVYYQALCLLNEATQIKMQCTSNDKIKILRTVYGYNPGYDRLTSATLDSCAFSIKDCNFDKEFTIDNECTGRNTCLVTIRKSRVMNESSIVYQTCKDFNYVQINYQCLPNLPTKDICGISHSELSHAYIMTPNFPNRINPGTTCECVLSSNYENGQILLRRVDMKLPNDKSNEACTGAYLDILENDKRSERKCGYVREAGSIFGSGASKLKLSFVTSDANLYDYGFWLEVIASPPKENHQIEIKCNRANGPIVGVNSLNNENSLVDNIDVIKKLKQIHEKIKRLNKTFSADPKLFKLHNKTLTFLNKNSKKLINMTNTFGLIGKKIYQHNKFSVTQSPRFKPTVSPVQDLENEIEDFFASKDTIGQQIDEIDRPDDNSNRFLLGKKVDKSKDTLFDDLQPQVKHKKINKLSKESKMDLSSKSKLNLNSDLNELDSNPPKLSNKKSKNQEKLSENNLMKELDSLNEELDIGEKILAKDDPNEASSILASATSISDTLAELIPDSQNLVNQGQIALSAKAGSASASSNAQLQDLGHGEQQSSSTDYEYSDNIESDLISTTRQHTLLKRNTMKQENSKIIKIQIKPKTRTQQQQQQKSKQASLLSTIRNVHLKAPAEWLQPFQFNFSNDSDSSSEYSSDLGEKDELVAKIKPSNTTDSPHLTTPTVNLIDRLFLTLGADQKNFNLTELSLYNSSIERSLSKLNQTFTSKKYKLIGNSSHSSANKLNINDYLSCERNLTRLTVFYSNKDKLNCFEAVRNASLLKCFDDLLETKLLAILGSFYYIQLQPLLISKSKVQCSTNQTFSNSSFFSSTTASSNQLTIEDDEHEEESNNFNNTATNETPFLKLTNPEQLAISATEPAPIYFNHNEKDNYLSKIYLKNSLNCTLITKKSSNRKKLVWKLYLILKNQTCIPMETFRSYNKLGDLKNGISDADSKSSLEASKARNNEGGSEKEESGSIKSENKSANSVPSFFSPASFSSNKVILITLIACSICFILLANTVLYIILKIRKRPTAVGNFSMSMSMNNRLLQNYLDLSVNSDAKNSGLSTPKVNIDKKDKNKKTKSINSQSANSDRDSTEYIFNKNYLKDHKEITKLQNKKLDSFELNNFDNLPIGLKDTKPKLINSQQSNENNAFDSITGLVVGPEQPHKILNEQYNSKLNDDYNYNSEYNYNNNSNYGENLTLNGKNQIISRVMNIDDVNVESTVEINRIPSFKKPKYSVSTIATQADMDKGSVIAERKDFKYRNQEMSDVESQILSIEVDLCSDIYSSIADWCQTKNSSNNNNQQVVPSTSHQLPNPYADRVISARKDFASVTVNDYVAFKNCLNFQLQAARAAAMAANQSDTDTFDNYKIEIIEKGADEQTAKSTIIKYPEQLSSFKPLACLFNQKFSNEQQQQQQPGRNRMIVRISSTKSSTRKGFGGETDPSLARAIENKPTSDSRNENEPRKQISSSTLVSSSSLIPFSSTSCGVSTNADNSPSDRKKQAFFGLSKEAEADSDEKVHKKLPKIILEAYRAAVASASSTSSVNSQELIQSKLNTKSFPNNLYMYLDSMPYLKSCVHEELLNAKLIKDKLFPMNKQQPSSTLKPIPDTNDTVTSSKLEESFNRCYELNAANLKAKEKLSKEESKIYENEINDPNTIYSQVSSNEDENYTGKSISEASSKTNSMCSSSSSSLEDRAENQMQKKILPKINETKAKGNDEELSKIMSKLISISSSSSELQKEMASYNLKPNLDRNQAMCSKHIDTPFTKREESPSKLNGQLTKAERIKKMLEEEKAALNLAKKASPSASNYKSKQENNYRVESPTSQLKSSFLAAFTSVVSKKPAQEHAFKEYNNSAYAKDLDESVEERVFKSNFFKTNKKRDGLLQNQEFNNEFESITIKSSFNKSNEGDEDEDSNGNGAKNVRFADDVSYI